MIHVRDWHEFDLDKWRRSSKDITADNFSREIRL
jgi:hypothetical protein